MKPLLKTLSKNVNEIGGRKKYMYTTSYQNNDAQYITYSNHDELCENISSLNIVFTNASYTDIIFGTTFSFNFNKFIIKPIHYSFVYGESYDALVDAIQGAVSKIFDGTEFVKQICDNLKFDVNDISINDLKNDDDLQVSVTVILDDSLFNSITNYIYRNRDTRISDTKLVYTYKSIGNMTNSNVCKRIHLTYSSIFNIKELFYKNSIDVKELMKICNEDMIFSREFNVAIWNITNFKNIKNLQDVVGVSDNKQYNEKTVANYIATRIWVTIQVTANSSQLLCIGQERQYTYKCSIILSVKPSTEDIMYILKNLAYDIDQKVLNVCVSNIENCKVNINNNNYTITVPVNNIEDYINLSKIENAEWVDM